MTDPCPWCGHNPEPRQPRPLWARAIAYPIAAGVMILSALLVVLMIVAVAAAIAAAWRSALG